MAPQSVVESCGFLRVLGRSPSGSIARRQRVLGALGAEELRGFDRSTWRYVGSQKRLWQRVGRKRWFAIALLNKMMSRRCSQLPEILEFRNIWLGSCISPRTQGDSHTRIFITPLVPDPDALLLSGGSRAAGRPFTHPGGALRSFRFVF